MEYIHPNTYSGTHAGKSDMFKLKRFYLFFLRLLSIALFKYWCADTVDNVWYDNLSAHHFVLPSSAQ